jgi:hypothetical protein
MMRKVFFIAVFLFLSACGSKLNGTYTSEPSPLGEMGNQSFRFEGSKVYMSVMGMETELKYSMDGNKIKMEYPQSQGGANMILTLNDDGSISGPMGMKFTKK